MDKVTSIGNNRFEPLLTGTQTLKCAPGTRYRAFVSVAASPLWRFLDGSLYPRAASRFDNSRS